MKVPKIQDCSVFRVNYKNLPKPIVVSSQTQDSFSGETEYIKSRLKDKDVLYNLYSNKDAGIPQSVLNNEKIMSSVYQDPEFIKASVFVLKDIVKDKLQDENLGEKDRNELLGLYTIFSAQADLYNNPLNSFEFEDEAEKLVQKTPKKKPDYYIPFSLQPSFGTIFNYGFFKKPKTRRQKAEAIVNRYATAAAGESALLLHVPTPGIETAALTATTIKMCRSICKVYEMPGGAITSLIAKISGRLAGKAMANYGKNVILKFFPGFGNGVNAVTTYSIHELQGRAIIEWCEKNFKKPEIADWDALAMGFKLFSAFAIMWPNPVDLLGDDDIQL